MNLADAITETLKTNTQDEFPSELTEGDLIFTKVKRDGGHEAVYMVIEVTPPYWALPSLPKSLQNECTIPSAPGSVLTTLKDSAILTCKLFVLGIKQLAHTTLSFSNTTKLVVIEVNTDMDKYLGIRGNCTRYPGEKGLLVTGDTGRHELVDTNLNLTARYGGNALIAYYN